TVVAEDGRTLDQQPGLAERHGNVRRQYLRPRLADLVDVRRSKKSEPQIVEAQLGKRFLPQGIFRPLRDPQAADVLAEARVFQETWQIAPDLIEHRQLRAVREGACRITFREESTLDEDRMHR